MEGPQCCRCLKRRTLNLSDQKYFRPSLSPRLHCIILCTVFRHKCALNKCNLCSYFSTFDLSPLKIFQFRHCCLEKN